VGESVGEVDGVDVEYHTSNIEADRGLELLPAFFGAVFEHAGERIHFEYFRIRNRTRRAECGRTSATFESVASGRKASSAGVLQKVAHYLSDLEGREGRTPY